jgi:CRISPR/Cas system-associated exonuclease Cas4 (RecB family)
MAPELGPKTHRLLTNMIIFEVLYVFLFYKNDQLTKKLRDVFGNNSWNLKDKAKVLKIKMDTEQNSYFNGWLNEVYLLDYKTGEKHNKHKVQLQEYELALQEMNYKVAKKVLIYIADSIDIVTL